MTPTPAPRPPLREQRAAETQLYVETLALIQPLSAGVGGWEHDPFGNNRGILRPKLPLHVTSEMYAVAAREHAKETQRLIRVALKEGRDTPAWDAREPAWDAVERHEKYPGDFYARVFRRMAGPGWQLLQEAVYLRDGGMCRRCGLVEGDEVDHINERWNGGADCMENLQLLCYLCHHVFKGVPAPWWELPRP